MSKFYSSCSDKQERNWKTQVREFISNGYGMFGGRHAGSHKNLKKMMAAYKRKQSKAALFASQKEPAANNKLSDNFLKSSTMFGSFVNPVTDQKTDSQVQNVQSVNAVDTIDTIDTVDAVSEVTDVDVID